MTLEAAIKTIAMATDPGDLFPNPKPWNRERRYRNLRGFCLTSTDDPLMKTRVELAVLKLDDYYRRVKGESDVHRKVPRKLQ